MTRTGPRSTDTDRHVGARIRERRIMMGMTLYEIAQMIGVTYQQAQKYERGLNRISAGRLFEVARTLRISPAWFFEGLGDDNPAATASPRQRMCLDLVRNFILIQDEAQQRAISHLARSMAEQD